MKFWISIFIILILSFWVDFGSIHSFHTSDSLIMIMVSLYKWTFYVWQLCRIGTIPALIGLPVESPFWNLIVQNGTTIFFGLASIFLVVRICFRNKLEMLIWPICISLYFLTQSDFYQWQYLSTFTPLGPGLFFGLCALTILYQSRPCHPWEYFIGFIFIFCSLWSNIMMSVFIASFVVLQTLIPKSISKLNVPASTKILDSKLNDYSQCIAGLNGLFINSHFRIVLLGTTCISIGFGLIAVNHEYSTPYEYLFLKPSQWYSHFVLLIKDLYAHHFSGGLGICISALVIAASFCCFFFKTKSIYEKMNQNYISLLVSAIVYTVVFRIMAWPAGSNTHYFLPSFIVSYTVLASWSLYQIFSIFSPKSRKILTPLVVFSLFVCIFINKGLPSYVKVRLDIKSRMGYATQEIIDSNVSHITGSFWDVWVMTYYTNLVLYENGDDRKVWAVTYMALPTMSLWRNSKYPDCDMKFAVRKTESKHPTEEWASLHTNLPPRRLVRNLKNISIWEPDCAKSKVSINGSN